MSAQNIINTIATSKRTFFGHTVLDTLCKSDIIMLELYKTGRLKLEESIVTGVWRTP